MSTFRGGVRPFKPPLIMAVLVVAALSLSMLLVGGPAAVAQPQLLVTKNGGTVLLGGDASIQITVKNTGLDRGFNLSLTDVFTSIPQRGDGKNKTVQFVSASSSDGPLTPTSVTTDPTTNAMTVSIDDIRDLMPTESTTITMVVRPVNPVPPDSWPWQVNDKIHDAVTAKVNTRADGGGSWITGSATADTNVIPIKLLTKIASQSTADKQATGCGELPQGGWPYSYTLNVQNNYTTQTDSVVVTDTIPDGIEYLGAITNPPTTVSRDNATGKWALTWNIGSMAASASFTATYSTGIRYDYFGTNNGGTNRPYNNYSWLSGFGVPIPNGTGLTNIAGLNATFQGTPVTDSDDAGVTAAYATIHKGVSPGTAGNGSTVHFSLTRYASEYYDTSNHVVVDVLPDGLTYTAGSASIAPDSIEQNTPGPGQTRLTWNTLGALTAGHSQTITFDATVDHTWSVDPSPDRNWVVAGDSVSNKVDMSCNWADVVQPPRSGSITDDSSATVVAVGPKPPVTKEVASDNSGTPGTYGSSINATVGDVLWFRVRVNTSDGANPTVHNVQFGNLDVVDWLPQGTQMTDVATMHYSNEQPDHTSPDFHYSPPPVKYTSQYNQQPQAILSGPLTGEAWSLGNVSENGWWEVQFKVTVLNDTGIVKTGQTYNDYGKTSWENSKLQQYSDRAIAAINYGEPHLTAAKAVTSPPAHPGAGQTYGYTITLTNDGTAAAHNVQVTDTLPVGMRGYDPRGSTVTVKRGTTTLALGSDYTLNYTPASGQFVISFDNGTIDTKIPPPPATDNYITIEYSSKVDSTTGASASLTNNTSTTYSAQKSNVTPNRNYGPVTASANVTLPGISMAKSIVGSSTVPIGNGAGSVVTYRVLVTVPARNIAPSGVQLVDVISQDSLEYVTGATPRNTLLTPIISGSPDVAAQFSAPGHPLDADPTTISWHTPNPGTTLNWSMSPIDNHGSDTDYVFQVDYKLLASGLIKPVSQGGTDIPSNWEFWPNNAPPGPTGDNTVPDTGTFKWNDGIGSQSVSNGPVTTHVQQPYLEMTKTNNKPGTVRGGDVVTYTLTVRNTGTSTSYDNTVVDQLPSGMLGAVPSVTSVTLNATPLTNPANYHYTYNGSGKQTFNLDGDTATNMAPGDLLTIVYTATVEGDVGSGATLTNNSYCEYYSQAGSGGRHVQNGSDSANKNKASSSVHTAQATVAKSIVSGDPAIIGDTVTYDLTVTVPEGTNLYPLDANGWTVTDKINQDGQEYNSGSATPIYVSGTPVTAAAFHTGCPPPDQTYYPPTHGDTLVWHLDKVENPTPGAGNYVFSVRFTCKVTGLITQVSRGGSPTNQSNWTWWWPTANDKAYDYGRIDWSDGLVSETASTPGNPNSVTTNIHQPALDLTKAVVAPGGVGGGATIQYTTTVTNNGTSTSYKNKVVDTLPVGMRQATPTVTQVTLAGVTLTENVDYWLNPPYDPSSGVLTIDLDNGVSHTNILTGSANKLVVKYQTTVDPDVGAGRVLTNIASVAYGSKSDGSGRNVPTNLDVSQHNTKSSTVTVPSATIAKTQDTVGNKSAIGQPFHYNIDLTIPAHASTYDTTATDTVPDGLNVDGYATFLDGVSQSIGSVALTPQGDGSTKVDWTAIETVTGRWQNNTGSNQVLRLQLTVHIKNAFHGGALVTGLGANPSKFNNTATMHWNESPGANPHSPSSSAPQVTTTEPYLNLGIVNHASGPVPGDTTVGYTVTATNAGTSTSYRNLVEITMPPGMRNATPVITDIHIGAYHFVPSDYTTTYVGGLFTINMLPGAPNTNIPISGAVIVDFNGKTDVGVGSGASLKVLASIGYNSWSDGTGRQTDTTTNVADHNTKDTAISTVLATLTKTQDTVGNKSAIGQPFHYWINVTVPADSSIYNATATDVVPDGLSVDSYKTYLDSVEQSIGNVAWGPHGNDTKVDWTAVENHSGYWENSTGSSQVLSLCLTVHIKNAFNGGGLVKGTPPQSIFNNSATVNWNDSPGANPHSATNSATQVTATEPYLNLGIVNHASGPVPGDSTVGYTVTATNAGTSTSYRNLVEITMPPGMRNTTPAITDIHIGAYHFLPSDYGTSYNVPSGLLTINMMPGAPNTDIPLGAAVVVDFNGKTDADVGSGASLAVLASIGYNSWSDGSGRQTDTTTNTADHNTKDTTISTVLATMAKTQNAPSNNATIGSTFDYTVTVTVPANEKLWAAGSIDVVPDGLTVTGATTATGSVGYVENPDGTTTVTWSIGDYTNTQASPVDITLTISVRVDDKYSDGSDVEKGDTFGNTATVGWYDNNSTDPAHHHQDQASADDVTICEPDLSITKNVDNSNPEASDSLLYTVQVTNNGDWPAYNVTVNDSVESGLTYTPGSMTGPGTNESLAPALSWDIQAGQGAIAPAQVITLTYRATVDGGTTMGQVIHDTAAITAYDGGQAAPYGRVYGPISASTAITVRAPVLTVVKEVTSNPNPDWGETVGYKVTVTNTGDAPASNLNISDTIPSPHFHYVTGSTSATWPTGSSSAEPAGAPGPVLNWNSLNAELLPSEQLVLTFDMGVDQWAAFGLKTNYATSHATDEAGTALPDVTGSIDILVKQHPGISVTKTLNNPIPFVPIGDTATYTMNVTNTGNTTIPTIPMIDTYDPSYLGYVSATKTPDSQTAGTVTWNDLSTGGLAPQQSTNVSVTLRALQTGVTPQTDDVATVTTVDDQGNPINGTDTNTALTITNPDLKITKVLNHPDDFVPVGNTLSYTIHIENTGDTAAVAPIQLTDTYNATYLQFTGATPPASTGVPGTVTWADASGGAGIPSSGSIDVTVNFKALVPGRTPNTDNTASVVATDEHGAPLSDTVTNSDLVVTDPKLTVTKQLAPGQEPQIKVGENVTYRIVVANTGDTKVAAPVTLTDQYDGAYLSYQTASTTPTSDSGSLLKWSDLSNHNGLTPGASITVDVVFKTLQEGTAPNTSDTATVAGSKDEHGDPIAPTSADAYVDVGPNKVLGATDWFLAEGSTGGGFDTWILLQNPGKVQANVAVTFATASGPRPPLNVVVPAESRSTIRIQDYVPNDFHVSTIVKSDVPICAERSMYWDKRFYGVTNQPGTPQPYEMKAGHANMGTPMDSVALAKARKTNADVNPGERLYFPEGSTQQGFDDWILVCNPGNVGAYVQVHLMTPNGEVNGGSFGVPQQSRYTLHVNDLLPNVDQVSVELDSNQPVVAERSMYWDPNASQLQPYQMKGGTSSPGSDDPANDWYIAEGSTAVGFETYVLVQNPQPEATRVTADFMTSAGVASTDIFDMGPNSRATIKVSDFVAGDFHVSTRIHADHPVVAERSMYWDKRKAASVVQMTEGHSAAGVTHTAGLWTVPEGSTGGGFDSWVLISNPTDKDTTADVTFMTAQGPTQPMTISLPASTRYTLHVNDFVPNDFHVSTLIQTKGQIVVERAMYWDRRAFPGIQPYEMMGGHSTTGVDP